MDVVSIHNTAMNRLFPGAIFMTQEASTGRIIQLRVTALDTSPQNRTATLTTSTYPPATIVKPLRNHGILL